MGSTDSCFSLGDNNIGDSGARALASGLKKNRSLTKLQYVGLAIDKGVLTDSCFSLNR